MEIPANESLVGRRTPGPEDGGHRRNLIEAKPPDVNPASSASEDIPGSRANQKEKRATTSATSQAEDLEEPEKKPLWAISFSRGNKMAHRVQKASWGLPLDDVGGSSPLALPGWNSPE